MYVCVSERVCTACACVRVHAHIMCEYSVCVCARAHSVSACVCVCVHSVCAFSVRWGACVCVCVCVYTVCVCGACVCVRVHSVCVSSVYHHQWSVASGQQWCGPEALLLPTSGSSLSFTSASSTWSHRGAGPEGGGSPGVSVWPCGS